MIEKIMLRDLPVSLQNISSPPAQLYIRAEQPGTLEALMARPRVAIVGSRRATPYGLSVTAKFARELAAHGVVIVSGLAIGIDAVAHKAAIEAGGLALAVLPGPVERVYPRSHESLAMQIIASGGLLASEYPAGTITYKPNFIARNRIVTGLANALLVTEATEHSGTLYTADFATQQGVDVLAVPGSITSPLSEGTNNLIKSYALPATNTADVLLALGINSTTDKSTRTKGANADEQHIIDLLEQGISDGNELLNTSGFSVEQFNHHLTMLEITAKIRPLGANHWALR